MKERHRLSIFFLFSAKNKIKLKYVSRDKLECKEKRLEVRDSTQYAQWPEKKNKRKIKHN